jgi:hypothetical protein
MVLNGLLEVLFMCSVSSQCFGVLKVPQWMYPTGAIL